MKITKYKKHSREELFRRLRKVILLNTPRDNPVFIYESADIELLDVPVSALMPAQFYKIEEIINKISGLKKALQKQNLDLFNLEGYLSYQTSESDNEWNLLPVIVEYQLEKDGNIYPLILDGLHRVSLARDQKRDKIQIIKIVNKLKDFPPPAFANPRGWEDVKILSKAPESKDKKYWRFPLEEVYNYYRNFNSAFDNVGKPRK